MTSFQVGEFREYKATRDIRLGGIENFQFTEGDSFLYDGVTLQLRDGRKYEMTQLRQAIEKQWFVEANQTGGYRSQSAQIQVSETEGHGFNKSSKTTMGVQQSDEVVVGSYEQRKAWREGQPMPKHGDRSFYATEAFTPDPPKAGWVSSDDRGDNLLNAVVNTLDLARFEWEREHGVQMTLSPHRTSSMPVVHDDVENAGTWVAKVEREDYRAIDVAPRRPAQPAPLSQETFNSGSRVFTEERDLGGIVTSGGSRPAINLDAKARVGASEAAAVKLDSQAQVSAGGSMKVASPVKMQDGSEGRAVGRVLSPTVTKVDMTKVSSNAVQQIENKSMRVEHYATGDVQQARASDTLEGLLPEAAATPRVNPDEEKLKMIRQLLPDFTWDKDRPTKQRVADALKHIKRPEYMRAILMYETDACAAMIKEEMAKLMPQKG